MTNLGGPPMYCPPPTFTTTFIGIGWSPTCHLIRVMYIKLSTITYQVLFNQIKY